MATWSGIERSLDKLEDLDKVTLQSFARVMPPASENPNFNRRFDHAMKRIRLRLDQIAVQESRVPQDPARYLADEKWYKKPLGIIAITVAGGLLLALTKYVLGL